MYARFFALYAYKIQTCAYHARSKNQRYANSFQFYAYSDKIPLKLSQNGNFQLDLSGYSVNNQKVVTILMQRLIIPCDISCTILVVILSYLQ